MSERKELCMDLIAQYKKSLREIELTLEEIPSVTYLTTTMSILGVFDSKVRVPLKTAKKAAKFLRRKLKKEIERLENQVRAMTV